MSWPKGIYVATVTNGVYYTGNFETPSTQPTWTAVNTGLANVGCREFKLDPFDAENKQYVLTESDRILYRRDNLGSWASILTPAEANTLLSSSGLTLHSFCVDASIPGRLWALVGATEVTVVAVYSDDYGENWTATSPIYTSYYLAAINKILADGDKIWISASTGSPSTSVVKYSLDKGTSWATIVYSWGYGPRIFHNPAIPGRIYAIDPDDNIIRHIDAGVSTATSGFCDTGSGMWFDPEDADHQRSLYDGDLLETEDNWATYATVTPDVALSHISARFSGSAGQMLVGLSLSGQNHAVGAMMGFTATVTGIAGPMPGTAPYTNSIPKTCGGACIDGVQGVRALGQIYTYGVAMPGYAGSDRGTPLPGDRAAWDAEHYPTLHANDIDGAATDIHHTLGDGEFQAASGAHTVDTNNPHQVSKAQVGLGNVANILDKLDGATAPTVDDDAADGYSEGSRWVDVTNDKIYFCLDATEGAAVWQEVGAGGGGSGDMLKSTYDTDDDGVVDEAEAVDGVDAAGNSKYYGTDGSGTPGFHSLPAGGVVDAADVTYTPAVLADWDGGTDPGNADDAFDQVAERLKDLEDGGGTDATAVHDNVANEIHAITEKTTPVDDDEILIEDSADSYNKKRVKISNLPSGGGYSALWSPDIPPSSPNTEDDEFNSSTLDAKWTKDTDAAADDVDTTWPSHAFAKFTGDQYYSLEQDYAPAGQFSLTMKAHFAQQANYQQVFIEIWDSPGTTGVQFGYAYNGGSRKAFIHSITSGSWTYDVRTLTLSPTNTIYLHIQRDGSNNWRIAVSFDGFSFWVVGSTYSKTFSVDHFKIGIDQNNATIPMLAGIDWVRRDWITL